jgi:hypothetical protein
MNSVVHTGVKSEGWEKSSTYLPLAGVIAQLDDAMRALRFEVGRLLKDAWDACFGAHVSSSSKLGWQLAFRALFPGLLSSTREPAAGGRLRVDDRMSGFEACDSI